MGDHSVKARAVFERAVLFDLEQRISLRFIMVNIVIEADFL